MISSEATGLHREESAARTHVAWAVSIRASSPPSVPVCKPCSVTTQRASSGVMDLVTKELLRAKDEEMARLAETVLRIDQVLAGARHIDRETRLLLDVLQPDIQHALRTYNRSMGQDGTPK